jgi:Tol biopolymer transport system component
MKKCRSWAGVTMTALALTAGCGVDDNRDLYRARAQSPQGLTPTGSSSASAPAAAPPAPGVSIPSPGSANGRDGAMGGDGIPVVGEEETEPPNPAPAGQVPQTPSDDEPDPVDEEPDTEEPDMGPEPEPPPCELGDFGAMEKLSVPGVSGALYGPSLSAAGTALFFVEANGPEQIFSTSRSSASSTQFSAAARVVELASNSSDGTPFLSASGLRIYFRSARAGSNGGSADLWVAERPAPDGAFGVPTPLSELNTASGELLPRLSADELSIVFTSQRPDGNGRTDLWRSRRSSIDAAFAAPENIVELNTAADETGGWLSSDGLTLFFSSNRAGGQGSLDIWRASRESEEQPFGPAEVMPVLNSPGEELDLALSNDERELFLSSNRDGIHQLWRSVRACR